MGGISGLWSPSELPAARLLGGHVPRWVPPGFGLAWKVRSDGNGEVRWTDPGCRAIWLLHRPIHVPPLQGDTFGRWTVHALPQGGLVYQVNGSDGTLLLDAAA
jgi:hypothetical protein